jgi:predicted SAM-dependent methyltransferase
MRILENVRKWRISSSRKRRISEYKKDGQKPWTKGYKEHREEVTQKSLNDTKLLDRFSQKKRLPTYYGYRIDERIIEYPWLFSKLHMESGLLLDVGSSLNFEYILNRPELECRSIIIYDLSHKTFSKKNAVSHIYGDIRETIFKDACVDDIVCISALEHIGMNNTILYSDNSRYNEFKPDDYRNVVKEFKRLLKPGGSLFITVPFGKYENHGWLQQFDYQMIETVIEVFGGVSDETSYYRYSNDSWEISDAETCKECSYFDFNSAGEYESDYVAAARAVACIEMIK